MKTHQLRCEVCRRPMEWHETYAMVNGQIVCNSPRCKLIAAWKPENKKVQVMA